MDIKEAIRERHSVRQYTPDHIMGDVRTSLETLIQECNRESGLNIQLITDDPECFDTLLGHYGNFTGVNNYIALVGSKKLKDLDELAGYYGEKIVLEAQMLGLNTCWVAGTYGKGKCKAHVDSGEKIVCVISIGYGATNGTSHRSKELSKLCGVSEKDMPSWFKEGVEAALLAPTAMNQQKFFIDLKGEEAVIKANFGPLTKLDLGIVRYNFEAASGHKCKAN
ncbi:nitroreductase family protein [Butyrivibrio sp. FCS014]|uniref:nitroreductase family protein n=1 Tax=Butyrivibrio sp. FCS014 TaxID=1408304 RepID=UPI0004672F88|nr:nitroreductase family protein [Butyrivibrio sp. FCS014]